MAGKQETKAPKSAAKTTTVEEQITQHFNQLESIEGVIINPYKPGTPIEEGFTAFMIGILHQGGRGKIKVEVFPDPKKVDQLKGLLYDNTETPKTLRPATAVSRFSTLTGTRFKTGERAYFAQ